jgi:hypothetical protein
MATAIKPKNRPVHEVRLGRIKAAVWANQTEAGVRHNVTVSRVYRDGDGDWQTSDSFGRDDLPLLAKVVDRAHSWIFDQLREDRTKGSAEIGDREASYDTDVPY